MWGRFLRWMRELPGRLNRQILWDALMVYLALLNLGLILFDFSYLWLRPQYYNRVPLITRIYDPVKGIEPHPVTEEYLAAAADLGTLLDGGTLTIGPEDGNLEDQWIDLRFGLDAAGDRDLAWRLKAILGEPDARAPLQAESVLARLRALSRRMLLQDPFALSGQTRSRHKIGVGMQQHLVVEGLAGAGKLRPREVVERFWSWDSELTPKRLAYFESDLAPLMAVNYDRRFDLDGEPTDNFWWIDLPFLILFTVEFAGRWILSIRRAQYPRWFIFPIVNWYDLLGIIPLKQFRVFRLFRIASIYVRLKRSDRSSIGDDAVTRTVKYFSNIISEEISDMVSLRILNETQEELRQGTHREIIQTVMASHRAELTAELTARIRDALTSEAIRDQARSFLDANLERAVSSAPALQRLPLPDSLLRPLVETIGRAVFESIADTLAATVSDEQGEEALQEIVASALDRLTDELTSGELEKLVRSISNEVIEQVKIAVSVRKWILPESKPITDREETSTVT